MADNKAPLIAGLFDSQPVGFFSLALESAKRYLINNFN